MFPIPPFFDPNKTGEVWRVEYAVRSEQAAEWARKYGIMPASKDQRKVWLLLVDVQNTFCIPSFELYVGGRSGNGAVDDNRRLCEFIYRNLGSITGISATMDTHHAMQIFHPIFLIDANGNHPAPHSMITAADLRSSRWRFNPDLADQFNVTPDQGQRMLIHYAETLERKGKYALTIWPYHAMLGGVGHALVSSVEEAIFFHSVARKSQTQFEVKGEQPFTENYSVIGPEVLSGPDGEALGVKNQKFIAHLEQVDMLIIAGQAKSHCVAWTISDLLGDIRATDESLAKKVYLLEDCSSPVVVPGVVDFTDQADAAYAKFAEAGMHLVESTDFVV